MLQAGTTVHFDKTRTGTVVAHGDCGWPRCKFGADCVTILPHDKAHTTINRPGAAVAEGTS